MNLNRAAQTDEKRVNGVLAEICNFSYNKSHHSTKNFHKNNQLPPYRFLFSQSPFPTKTTSCVRSPRSMYNKVNNPNESVYAY